MDKSDKADRDAVKLTLQELGKEAILGIFGSDAEDQMIGKMYAVIDMASHLRINNISITITLPELVKARIKYLQELNSDDSRDV
jgi:hypothetical protein